MALLSDSEVQFLQKKRLTLGEERPILPYPPERMVGVWTVRGGWSINCVTEGTKTSSSETPDLGCGFDQRVSDIKAG